MITREQAIEVLEKFSACTESLEWFMRSRCEPKQAWNQCSNPDWLIWLAETLRIDSHKITLVACECAKAVLHLIPEDEERPRLALELAEKWFTDKGISAKQLCAATTDAYAAYNAVARINATYACYAADAIHCAVKSVAFAAQSTVVLANNYADVAVFYAAAATTYRRTGSRMDIPNIIRKHIPWSLIEEKLNKL